MSKLMPVGKWTFEVDTQMGIYPIFSVMIRNRVKHKKAVNIAVVGEAGEGKSYQGIDIARVLDKNFSLSQVVFTFKEFLGLIIHLEHGRPIVFDEPSYAMGKRDWYKDLNKALVLTMESFRFKVHPLIIPVINLNLLDKSIRSYLIQYMVYMIDRGKAIVYRIKAKQSEEGFYKYHLCDLNYEMFDIDKCQKESCLSCQTRSHCKLFRAEYERKKAVTQDERYEQSLTNVEQKELESRDFTTKQFMELIDLYKKEMVNEREELEAIRIRSVLLTRENVKIGKDKANFLRKHYLFQESLKQPNI